MPFHRRIVLGLLSAALWPARSPAALLPAGPEPGAEGAAPAAGADGFIVIEARKGVLRLVPPPAAETAVWGFEGHVPGPLLRIKKGEELKVRLKNQLDQPLTLSWQGMRGPNAMDGIGGLTQAPVAPGGTFDYRFTPPDSGLFWYHSHVWPHTAEQTARGLYGVLIVEEPSPPPRDAELVVVIQEWRLDGGGQIDQGSGESGPASRGGQTGPVLTLNSAPVPVTSAMPPGTRLRLRLVSAAISRILLLVFEGCHPQVLAIDGQPCEMFEPVRQSLPVGPGATFDLIIDLPSAAGQEMRLVSRWEGQPDQLLLALKTEGEAVAAHGPVVSLPENPALPVAIALEKAFKMDIVIDGGSKPAAASPAVVKAGQPAAHAPPAPRAPPSGPTPLWTLNGAGSGGVAEKPLFKVKRGEPVSLALVNKTAFLQQIQIRGHALRLLHDLDDGWEPYWRDAVLIPPGRTKHVAFVADNPGKWALESAILDRQVTGLAAWFEVG